MAPGEDDDLKQILKDAVRIAVVGASQDPGRDSTRIMKYLISAGYEVTPVNPNYDEVLGKKCYPTLSSMGEAVDIVDVFRRSEFVVDVARDAVASHAKVFWMQLGVLNDAAVKYVTDHGMKVVVNRCIMVEHRRLVQ